MLIYGRLLLLAEALQTVIRPAAIRMPSITISDKWHALGPFTIGTREAAWGADPLEHYGGFHALQHADGGRFRSALMPNGTATWSEVTAALSPCDDGIEARLSIGYENVDWTFLQQIYGWATLQWQGWVRGIIRIESDVAQLVNIHLEQVLELWIDDKYFYGGDFYGFQRAAITLNLQPGAHQIDIRLIRDTRAIGGITSNPKIDVGVKVTPTMPDIHAEGEAVLPDRLEDKRGQLASTMASVILRNDHQADAYISAITGEESDCTARLEGSGIIHLVAGQSRPVAISLDGCPNDSTINLRIEYRTGDSSHASKLTITARKPVSKAGPQVVTYMHPGGFVSHAVLRPPPVQCRDNSSLPVLLVLHGAGVDIKSDETKHALDDVADLCAWTLIPSGGTTWCGDDWHQWGWADVEAALTSIETWIKHTGWDGPGVDLSRWLVAGHSNGGQGVWYALTHHADNIIAAAPISGYSSIQNYVPYSFWQPAESAQTAVVQAQLAAYRHESLLANTKDIPILQQHGTADDNVPAYHSRLMHDLILRAGSNSTLIEYPGQPHWWDGIMTTDPLKAFYKQHLDAGQVVRPRDFTLVVANPADSGSKGGVRVLQSQPGLLSRIRARVDNSTGRLTTSNVAEMAMDRQFLEGCTQLIVDDQTVTLQHTIREQGLVLSRSEQGEWTVNNTTDPWKRRTAQYGGLEAILRTNGAFQVVQHSSGTEHTALQVANSLLQYFNADVALAPSYESALSSSGNIISIALGQDLLRSPHEHSICRFEVTASGRMVAKQGDKVLYEASTGPDGVVAAAFLRPLPGKRLELVLWASDLEFVDISARFLPLLTGSGLPDFVFANRAMLSHGLGGVSAIGFLDSMWCPTSTSYFPGRFAARDETA